MSRRGFHGSVKTIGDSCAADYLVIVHCERCGTHRQTHPYKLIARRKTLATAPLDAPLSGFYCKACAAPATVRIVCTYTHPGGW